MIHGTAPHGISGCTREAPPYLEQPHLRSCVRGRDKGSRWGIPAIPLVCMFIACLRAAGFTTAAGRHPMQQPRATRHSRVAWATWAIPSSSPAARCLPDAPQTASSWWPRVRGEATCVACARALHFSGCPEAGLGRRRRCVPRTPVASGDVRAILRHAKDRTNNAGPSAVASPSAVAGVSWGSRIGGWEDLNTGGLRRRAASPPRIYEGVLFPYPSCSL